MQLSRFASLLIGALAGAVLLAVIAGVTGAAAAIPVFAAGFAAAFVSIVVARMLEPATASLAAVPAGAVENAPAKASAHTSGREPASTSAGASPRESDRRPAAHAQGRPPAGRQIAPPAQQRSDSDRDDAAHNGQRMFGNVKWFNRAKGYGFIHCDDDREVFVHHRNVRGEERQSLQDGERVSFHIVERNRGPQAEDVAVEAQ